MRVIATRPDVGNVSAGVMVSGPSAWTAWRYSAAFALLAAGSLAAAIVGLVSRVRYQSPGGLVASAGLLLTLIAATQAWLAWRLRPQGAFAPGRADQHSQLGLAWGTVGGIWRRWAPALAAVFVGAAVCYLAMLVIGPRRGGALLFAAGTMGWITLLALPLTASPEMIDSLRRWLRRPGPRHCGQAAFGCCVALALVEGGLRSAGMIWGSEFLAPSEPMPVTFHRPTAADAGDDLEQLLAGEGLDEHGCPVGQGPACKQPAEPRRSAGAALRVAVIGDHRMTACEAGYPATASLLESSLADIEVVNVAAPKTHLRDCAAKALRQARGAGPDLLLVFVSVADDIVGESRRVDVFDWRSLSLARALVGWTGWPAAGEATGRALAVEAAAKGRWEDYVLACSPQLAACRKPLDASMHERWKSTFAYIDELEAVCRKERIPLALVVAPSPLQTNRALLDAVCRRQGCSSSDVDLEMPQRRLAVYAAQRNLPALDLLPAMKHAAEQPFVHQGWQWTPAGRASVAQALDGWLRSTFAGVLAANREAVAAAWKSGGPDRLASH